MRQDSFLTNVVIVDNMERNAVATANDPKDTARFMDQGGTERI